MLVHDFPFFIDVQCFQKYFRNLEECLAWCDDSDFPSALRYFWQREEREEKEKVKERKDPNGTEPSMSVLLYLNHLKPRCARGFPVKTSNILLQKMCIEIGICMQFKGENEQRN